MMAPGTQWVAIELMLSDGGAVIHDINEVFGPFPDELSALEFQGKMEAVGRDFLVVKMREPPHDG